MKNIQKDKSGRIRSKNTSNNRHDSSGSNSKHQQNERSKGRRTQSKRTQSRKLDAQEKRRQQILRRSIGAGAAILLASFIMVMLINWLRPSLPASKAEGTEVTDVYDIGSPTKQVPEPEIDVQLLTINEYSRPGIATDTITGIVIHYTANPGSTAQNNRDYFENLKDTQDNKVSSNFVIGLEGEIVQCIPTAEIAYASNGRNNDTVSIECCHPDLTGKFTDETYDSLVELTAFLCGKFNLDIDDVIRHYDVTGKDCPKYFVENEDEWQQFKNDIAEYIQANGA